MCGLCAALNASRNWTDASGQSAFTQNGRPIAARDEREKRVRIINSVLSHYGLQVADWGGSSYVITTLSGKNANVYNLGGIWDAADGLVAEKVIDPLDPVLLARLEEFESVVQANV